jgi:hypothetical protein
LPLAGKRVQIYEAEDGSVALKCEGRTLPFTLFDKNPHVFLSRLSSAELSDLLLFDARRQGSQVLGASRGALDGDQIVEVDQVDGDRAPGSRTRRRQAS